METHQKWFEDNTRLEVKREDAVVKEEEGDVKEKDTPRPNNRTGVTSKC